MQRSITYQRVISILIYIALFAVYTSLSSIYLILPPLFAVLFLLYSNALKKNDLLSILFISFCLILFEVNNGYLLFTSIIYLTLVHKFIMPKIAQNFNCKICIKISYVLFAYIGFYLFLVLLSKVFLLPSPSIDYYIVYYIVIEFFFVSII